MPKRPSGHGGGSPVLTGNPADQYSPNPKGVGPQRSTGIPKKKPVGPTIGIGNGPGHPHAVPKPHQAYDPYAESVAQNLKYLTSGQRAEVAKRQKEVAAIRLQAEAAKKNLISLQNLATKGEAGIRQQQSLLAKAGYNVAVDGKFGQATSNALNDYITKTLDKWSQKQQGVMSAAHPATVRSEANAKFTPQQINNNREFVLSYANNQQRDLRVALEAAKQEVRDGKAGADKKVQTISAAIKGLDNLRATASDPMKADAVAVHETMAKIIDIQKNELRRANEKAGNTDLGIRNLLVDTADDIILLTAQSAMEIMTKAGELGFNRGSNAFAAAFGERTQGGDFAKSMQAFLGSFLSFVRIPATDISLVGLIAPGGSDARKWIEATNTNAEMEAMKARGDLLSIGQTLTGRVTPEWAAAHPNTAVGVPLALNQLAGAVFGGDTKAQNDELLDRYVVTVHGFDFTSAAADFGAQIVKDPTLVASVALEPLNAFGNVSRGVAKAMKGAEFASAEERKAIQTAIEIGIRTARAETNVTGRSLMSRVSEVLNNTFTAQELQKSLPGIGPRAARVAIEAKNAEGGGISAAQAVIKQAFITGEWNPHISFVRQLTNDIGERVGLIGEETLGKALLGNKAVKLTDRLNWLRLIAEPKGAIAATYERDATRFIEGALHAAGAAERSTVGKLWDTLVGTTIRGLTFEQRLFNVGARIYRLKNAALEAAFEGNIRQFAKDAKLLDEIPLATYTDALVGADGFEAVLRKMEVVAALVEGNGAGARQFAADLARGFLPPKNWVKSAFNTAVENAGLKLGAATKNATRKKVLAAIKALPEEDRKFFLDRLEALQGNGGLGRLATDVKLAQDNPQLRAELARLVKQYEGRAQEAAAGLGEKRGLASRIVRSPAKAALAWFDTAPPVEIRFKYNTKNELAHAGQRAAAAERYLDAAYVPKAVRETLVRAAETVQTEEELFAVRDRIIRAVMEAKGIENPDAMMALLEARGSLKHIASKPLRAVFKGERIEDLQLLSQRVENTRLPRPAELAANYRQAILDGIENASTARRVAATLRVETLDRVGKIRLHFTNLRGENMTVTSSVQAVHRAWKFLIVTNAGLPIIGATAGLVGPGNIGDRMKNAGLGFAVGSLGGVRYVFRIAGVEERTRMLLNDGFNSELHIPGMARLKSYRMSLADPYRRTMSWDLVKTGRFGAGEFDNELMVHVDPAWVVVKRDEPRAVHAWDHILNNQLQPEDDEMVAILLREQAGHLGGPEEVTRVVKVEAPTPADTPLQQASADAAAAVGADGIVPPVASNEDLLAEFAGKPTKTFWRGEDNNLGQAYPRRGTNWIEDSAENPNFPGRTQSGEAYARGHATPEGRVYRVELPVDEHGVPLVGSAAEGNNMGWTLHGDDSVWADAATEERPPGLAGTAADAATYRTETVTVELTAKQAADRQIAAFLDTDEGRLWAARWRGAQHGATPKQAVKRMRKFLETYSTPELAAQRVAGGVNGAAGKVNRETLKRLLKEGLGPDELHARATWVMPKSTKAVFHIGAKVTNKFVLAGPSNLFNRGPFFRRLFENEYDRLVANGVERSAAQQLADHAATFKLNHVLDRMDDPSRFAKGVDIFMPFQQAREDTIKQYGYLIRQHPINALRLQSYAARLFNDGKEMGIFSKNEFTGQWEMTIPGSARLARTLFNFDLEANWTFQLRDLLFVGNGAYGQGFMPTLGGPFWGIAAKLLAEAEPGLFKGNNPVQDWLWHYGPGGTVLRRDTSRLWMAFTGDNPPWEKLTQDQWKNEHNRWTVEVAQQLIFEHRKKDPTNLDWFPTDEEVTDATKKFYLTWAFIGSTFPATPRPMLTGRDKYWAARNAMTVGGILPWDSETASAFLKKFPEFVPYTTGPNAEYIGPDDIASLNEFNVGNYQPLSTFDPKSGTWITSDGGKPGENKRLESNLGYRAFRSFEKFKDDFKFYKRQGEYFDQLHTAYSDPNPLSKERTIATLNKNYSDVVTKTKKVYNIQSELYDIQWRYPKALRAAAIERVKNQYGLSNADLRYYQSRVMDPLHNAPNAWREARLGSEVDAEVRLRFGNTLTGGLTQDTAYGAALTNGNVDKYVATLNPAEQANYWYYMRASLGYDPGIDSPYKVMQQYNQFTARLSRVYDEYPWLANSDKNYSQGTRTQVAGDAYKYPKVTYTGKESEDTVPGSTVQVTDATNFSRFTMPQIQDVTKNMWKELERLVPQYTKGIKVHFVRETDKEWIKVDHHVGAIARGSASGEVWYNLDAFTGMTAKTARFVLIKELGQANVDKFIKTKEGAALYHKAIGYKGKDSPGTPGHGLLGEDAFTRDPKHGGGSTNPADWWGRDFANALGFHSPESDSNMTPQQVKELQRLGVLPETLRVDTLTGQKYENPYKLAIDKMQTNLNATMASTQLSIHQVKSEMDAFAKAKNWKAFYALKDKQSQLYDVAEAIHNKFLNKLPDLTKYYDDVHAAALEGAAGNAKERDHWLHQAAIDKANAPYFLISEQRRFLHYPPAVQRAYSDTLIQGLEMPHGKVDYEVAQYVKAKTGLKPLVWEYLSPFQQDLLERNYPQFVEKWKYASDYYLHGPGQDKSKKLVIPPELQWAYDQLAAHNNRGDGQDPPDSYNRYLQLPANVAVREQFLSADIPLRDYINKGPLANMPETLRDSVVSVLTKYGNYNKNSGEGGAFANYKYDYRSAFKGKRGYGGKGTHIKDRGLGYEGNVNVAWAKEQLYIWSRRKDHTKPSNYDAWVNMPTGVEKAAYLDAHPDLQEWIKLGPMANMPDEYKQVVSDIMQRYGEWTQKDDPLGQVITQFFKTPGYAREEFLAAHPELEAYWAATRSPEEQQKFDLRNAYFKIQDVAARRAFLSMHPDLQQDFIDARTKRYESFLNQVAVYMGANPEMFKQYLDRQTDIMAELLHKFAEPVLIREVGPGYVAPGPGPESGRQRQQQRPPRVRSTV